MNENIYERYKIIRKRLEKDHNDFTPPFDILINHVDDFFKSEESSELEKWFYLLLNQFPSSNTRPYFVFPHEKVLIKNIYDDSKPFYEYEIDYAVYGGTRNNVVKIAIECDGLRSHGRKKSNNERRKEINLQSAGWFLIRIGSYEIHSEIEKLEKNEYYISEMISSIEKVIEIQTKLINYDSFVDEKFRTEITGYQWGWVKCTECGFRQMDILNHKKNKFRNCKKDFYRDRSNDPKEAWEDDGLLYFKNS